MTQLFRIMYRAYDGHEWELHIGRKGTQFYTTPGAARSAITQFKKRSRRYGSHPGEYKIQSAGLSEWGDVDA